MDCAVTAHDAAIKYYQYSTFLILGPTKGSGTEDKSFAEKSGKYTIGQSPKH